MNTHISETKVRSDKKHNNFNILLSFVLTNSSGECLQIKDWRRLRGEKEEVGFEPTARSSSSMAVRERPLRAQKAHPESTEVPRDMVSSTGSAVKSAVRKNLLI
jgi:hypothetical protein